MEQKELAGPAAPAAVAGAWMLLKLAEPAIHQPLAHRKGTMAPLMREAGRLKSAVAAVEQALLAQPEVLYGLSRQAMAEMEELLQSVEHLFIMRVEVVVLVQAVRVQAMVALAAVATAECQALPTLVAVAVLTAPAAPAS